jgi:hypothetical protein
MFLHKVSMRIPISSNGKSETIGAINNEANDSLIGAIIRESNVHTPIARVCCEVKNSSLPSKLILMTKYLSDKASSSNRSVVVFP